LDDAMLEEGVCLAEITTFTFTEGPSLQPLGPLVALLDDGATLDLHEIA